jgi:hypothetical protein
VTLKLSCSSSASGVVPVAVRKSPMILTGRLSRLAGRGGGGRRGPPRFWGIRYGRVWASPPHTSPAAHLSQGRWATMPTRSDADAARAVFPTDARLTTGSVGSLARQMRPCWLTTTLHGDRASSNSL